MGGSTAAGWGGQGGMLIQSSPFNWLINGPQSADAPSANIETQAGNMSGLSSTLQGRGNDQWARYQTLYQPVEQRMVSDAMSIDSQENQDRAAAEAGAQVRSSFAKAREDANRRTSSMGINPNSGSASSLNKQVDMQQAAGEAQAMNDSRQAVRDRGIAMRAGVVNQGNTVANNSALHEQTALQGYAGSGNLSIGGSNANTSAFNATTTAGSARTSQARGTINDILGSISGMGGFGSSKNIKTDKVPVSDEATLEKLKKIPVAQWKYKAGEGDGGTHIGAYAEDMHKHFGDQAAPGGKAMDMISLHGIEMSAIRGLAKQVDKLSKQVGGLQKATA